MNEKTEWFVMPNVVMGTYNGAEVSELVGEYMLFHISEK